MRGGITLFISQPISSYDRQSPWTISFSRAELVCLAYGWTTVSGTRSMVDYYFCESARHG